MALFETEFIIKFDYNKDSKKPSHVFKIMSELIESFSILDMAILSSIDSKIQPIVILEDIEKGSIISRFKYLLEIIPDDSIISLDWKKFVGNFLLKGKYAIIDFINNRETISSQEDIELLSKQLMDLSQEGQINDLTVVGTIDLPKLLSGIANLSSAISKVEENENIYYRIEDNDIILNLSFKFDKERIEDLLSSEKIVSKSEMILKIKKPDYLGDSKWEFRHRKETINANITDNEWLAKFRNREITLKPGDSIRANVEIEVIYDFDREVSSINYKVTKILKIIYSKPNNSIGLF